jgi:hypothetical protein
LPDEQKVNILAGVQGKVVFAVLVAIAAAALYDVSHGQPKLWSEPGPLSSLKLFIIIPVLGLMVFSYAESAGSFYGYGGLAAFIYGPLLALLLFIQSPALCAANAIFFSS